MNLAVIGSGGREHALCYKLRQSKEVKKLYCIPGNAGTKKFADNINQDVTSSDIPDFDTTGFFCAQPFTNLEVNTRGEVRTCCAYWMNQTLGNITFDETENVLNSDTAQDIRKSILDGSFSYCNKKTCPRIQSIPKGGDGILQRIEDVEDQHLLDIISSCSMSSSIR